MDTVRLFGLLLAGSLAACAAPPVAQRATLGAMAGDADVFVGRFASSGPACPALDFHVTMVGPNELSGVIFNPEQPAVTSRVTGTRQADGTIAMQIASMGGKGPSGPATGRLEGGHLTFNMVGGNCPIVAMPLMQVHMAAGNGA